MSIATVKAAATVSAVEGSAGEFDIILSAQTRDRDGDVLTSTGWKQPLPEHIPIGVDHGMSVPTIVGSGKPFINQNGDLQVRGTFASTDLGQQVRTLVNEGHLTTVSVEFLTDRNAKSGAPQRELVGGAFVYLPSNREAKVLSSKAPQPNTLDPDMLAQLVEIVDGLPEATDDDVPDMVQRAADLFAELSQVFAGQHADDGQGPPATGVSARSVSARATAMRLALGGL